MISFGRNILQDFEQSTSREWLETNGVGGYASGTLSGAHTRRYHGLLVAASKPPLGRCVLLSKYEETLIIDELRYELSTNQYPGAVHPTGCRFLKSFELSPFPAWTFEVAGIELKKHVFMPHGENTTVCTWQLAVPAERQISLELRPLVAFRDHHHLRQKSDSTTFVTEILNDSTVSIFSSKDLPELFLNTNAASAEPNGDWYNDLEYAIEEERGFDHHEDLFQPVALTFDLAKPATVIASTEKIDVSRAPELEISERGRRSQLAAAAGDLDDLCSQLVLAADQFIVKRGGGDTVIAGYHWFSDWGRDTMIALPGLTLSTGRPEIAKSIIGEFARHISEGMVPNRFPDAGEKPDYNTVDATLWYFEAIRAYLAATSDEEFVEELYPRLVEVIDWHVGGTRFNIHVDTDGLLFAGEEGVQLTWMDAKIGDWVVTPRTGKPVEIQALWYNALCVMADLAGRFDAERASTYSEMAAIARSSFNGQFWNAELGCLYDVINGSEKDASIRPNQVFAVSLTHTIVDPDRAGSIVEKVLASLFTPLGLRSLAPTDPRYAGTYIGSPFDRDASYHQGTVWGWLMGPFVDAYRKTHGSEPDFELRMSQIRTAANEHLSTAMVGQMSEIFDADTPHVPRGCAAQAWTTAEYLRILKKSA